MNSTNICYTDTANGRIIWRWDFDLKHWIMFAFVEHATR